MPASPSSLRCLPVAALLALSAPGASAAELRNLRFERLSLEEGLSQSHVNAILQDSRGFMWFGTQDGLNRYDGYRFTVFKHDPFDPTSLSSNIVWAIHEAADGTLWVGTDGGGLDRFDPRTGVFAHHRHDPRDPKSLSSDRVRAVWETRDGALWVGTDGGGLNRLERSDGSFTRLRHNPSNHDSLSSDRIRHLMEDREGALWISTDGGGLSRLDPARTRFTAWRTNPADPKSLSDDRVRSTFQDREGGVWVATYRGGLNRLDAATGTFSRFRRDPADPGSLGDDKVRVVYQDRSGILWVGTDGGLDEWRPDARRFVHYRHESTDPGSLSDDRVMSIYQDRGGVLWVGTQGGGLSRWNMVTSSFSLFRVDPRSRSTFTSNAVTSFESDGGGVVWVGTYQGLNRYERRNGTVRIYRHDPRARRSLSDDRVMSLLVDRRGTLWVGTLDGGLNRLDPATGGFTRLRHDPDDEATLSGDGVTSLLEDADGSLWVGVYRGGLNRLDPLTGRVTRRFRHDPAATSSLSSDRVIALARDSKGALWVGTEGGGLNRLDAVSGTFVRYRRDPNVAGSLSGDVVFSIHEDRRGTLWVGTQGAGLNRSDPQDRADGTLRFRTYTERHGLPNDSVYGILEDDSGDLWLSTNRGLSRLDPRREAFRNFDTSHGLQSNEFNFGAHHRAVTGEMFFGGNAGFNAFVPDRVRGNEYVPPLALTSVQKLGLEVNAQEMLARHGAIQLGHRDYVVSFEFAALDYSAPERNRYAYKLDGLDRDWIQVGSARRASYTNLSPGRYVFRVKGSNGDGAWNEEGLSVPVTVLPPPWRTWWAYAAYVLAVGAAFRGYVRFQARRLGREAEYSRRLEREVQERTAELALRNEELHQANQKLEEASLTDSLTGLGNRRFLMTHIRREVAMVDRYYRKVAAGTGNPAESRPDFALMMIDLDGLKGVNDAYGHAAGDRALVQMRDVLERACRKSDTILRWGGDEFLVVARQADHEVADMLAERVRRAVEEHAFDLGGHRPVHLGCSIGWAIYPFVSMAPGLLTWEQVGTIADRALYAAKSSGRNAWVGILSTPGTPQADTVHLINQRPGALVREGSIEVRTSLTAGGDLVWERRVEGRGSHGPGPLVGAPALAGA